MERDVYQCVEDGMEATLAIFKTVLSNIVAKKQFKVPNPVGVNDTSSDPVW